MTINLTDPANHPANGLLAVERIIRVREELQRSLCYQNGGDMAYVIADAIKGLEELLVSREAVPVGYFYADIPGDWYQISDGDIVPSHRRIPLYASPQSSPVVKLPNEFISSEGVVVQVEKVMAVLAVHGIQYERRGNACRAAMLQDGNSPVTPDGILESGEDCWACGKYFTYEQHSECDGYCPHCDSSVDLDDDEDQSFKVVPTEPTEEMISNAWREAVGKCDHETIKRIYATMLAAAQKEVG